MPIRRKPSLTLCVFIDALGWELLRNRSFLDDLLPTRTPLDTVFGYSCTCAPTILTGKMPRDHGHLSFWSFAPDRSPFTDMGILSRLPSALANRGRVRRVLSRWVARRKGFSGYFQLYNVPFDRLRHFDYLEKKDIYQPNGLVTATPTIFDWLRQADVPFFLSNWRASEEQNLHALAQALDGGRLRFAYLYLAALDALLHAHGTRADVVARHIEGYETRLRRVVALARRWHDVRILLFSDHGMSDVTSTCDLIPRIESLGLAFGEDYAAMYDSTMARFWFLAPRARDAIVEVLSNESRGHIVSDAQLRAWGVDFTDRRYGDLFFLLDPGVLLCPSYMGRTTMAGMHGYRPEEPHATAAFATNVHPPPRPRRLDDLFGVMQDDVLSTLPHEVMQ